MTPEGYDYLPYFDKFRIPDCRPAHAKPDLLKLVRKHDDHPPGGNGYVIRIADKSMEPRFESGDKILVDYAKEPQPGHIIIGTINGRAVVKKFLRRKGRVILHSTNPRYADIEIRESDRLVIAGVVLRIVDGAI